ncbi:MAG: GNAT family N-acetyltransferase [Myxococcales bacterium]|nr:GNAT family N-acetyltransferase [Myxococcales bacterium]
MTRPSTLRELPLPILTPRLELRAPRPGDGPALNAAVLDSFAELTRWLPWARARPTVDESEDYVRRCAAAWLLRSELPLLGFERASGTLVVSTGLHRVEWDIPSFEIGYWARTAYAGRGLVSEAVNAVTRYAFAALAARRVEIRCDVANARSIAVIERLGFEREGVLRRESLAPDGGLRDTLVASRLDAGGLPALVAAW